MSKKRLCITVRGQQKEWAFTFYGDPKHLPDWRADGLEVYETVNTCPEWVAAIGLSRPWFIVQDIFNFTNPFRK